MSFLLGTIFTKIGFNPFTTLFVGGEEKNPGNFLTYILPWHIFFESESETNDGVEYTDYVSKTGLEILTDICTFFGFLVIEHNTRSNRKPTSCSVSTRGRTSERDTPTSTAGCARSRR